MSSITSAPHPSLTCCQAAPLRLGFYGRHVPALQPASEASMSCGVSSKQRKTSRQGHLVSAAAETEAAGAVRPTEWLQRVIELPPFARGCHVVTQQLMKQLPELAEFEVGLANLFVQHTSASLTINENASPDVPLDLADSLDRLVPNGTQQRYRHDEEGPDDMPAHVQSSLMGASLTVPVQHGRLALGIWQGIYLNEHRDYGGLRRVVVTVQGQRRADGRRYSGYR